MSETIQLLIEDEVIQLSNLIDKLLDVGVPLHAPFYFQNSPVIEFNYSSRYFQEAEDPSCFCSVEEFVFRLAEQEDLELYERLCFKDLITRAYKTPLYLETPCFVGFNELDFTNIKSVAYHKINKTVFLGTEFGDFYYP